MSQPFEIAPGIKRVDDARIVVGVVPEVDELTVGEEDERRAEALGIGGRLVLGGVGFDGQAFRFDDGEGPAVLAKQHVVRARPAFGSLPLPVSEAPH